MDNEQIARQTYARWIKKRTRLWEWNECSNCGYKSKSTIWHEDVTFPQCPMCGLSMENYSAPVVMPWKIERKIVWNIAALPPIGRCLKYGSKAKQDNRCLHCGWNETEYRRRLQCPWVLQDGLWHLDISIQKGEKR